MKIANLNVTKSGNQILNNLAADFKDGKKHVIMGPNGSGKSTLFYSIAGHPDCEISSGHIEYKNLNLVNLPIHERNLNGIYLSVQYPPQIEGLSHAAFLKEALNSKLKFLNKEPVDEFQFLKQIKALSKKYSFPSTYFKQSLNVGFSGGEKKRNEILQIELLDPDLLMLDEIDSGLDIEMMKTIQNFINEFSTDKKTSLIITHYPDFANMLEPDFVHILKGGKIVATGGKEIIKKVQSSGFGDF